jgi:NADH-quinone oxidoreductase subunit G
VGRSASKRAAEKLKVSGDQIGVIAGDLADAEGMKASRSRISRARLGVKSIDCRQDGAKLGLAADGSKLPARAICSTRPSPASKRADAVLLVGTNPRREAPCSMRASASAGCGGLPSA